MHIVLICFKLGSGNHIVKFHKILRVFLSFSSI